MTALTARGLISWNGAVQIPAATLRRFTCVFRPQRRSGIFALLIHDNPSLSNLPMGTVPHSPERHLRFCSNDFYGCDQSVWTTFLPFQRELCTNISVWLKSTYDGARVVAVLERVQGGIIGQTLSSFGITGLYITFVFGIGRFLRFSTQNARMRIQYEDLPTTQRLVALCQVRCQIDNVLR